MANLQKTFSMSSIHTNTSSNNSPELVFEGVFMAGKPENSRWDVCCRKGVIESLEEHTSSNSDPDKDVQFLCPSLCHPHIHLDKCFLLSHPKYADLGIKEGDFAEALSLTGGSIFVYSRQVSYSRRRRSKVSI